MTYKKTLLFFLVFSLFSCGKNEEKKNDKTGEPNKKLDTEQKNIKPTDGSESETNDSIYLTPEDSIRVIKESVLRKQNYKKKKQSLTLDKPVLENTVAAVNSKKNTTVSFLYIQKILKNCKIGVPMTQEELSKNFNIPEDGIKLVKSVTKISDNELDVKWKSTWLIEKISDAKFKDGRLKVHFDKNKMYTSGGAIAIKYEKKIYTDLYLIGRSAYIPTVKGYYWQIGKD